MQQSIKQELSGTMIKLFMSSGTNVLCVKMDFIGRRLCNQMVAGFSDVQLNVMLLLIIAQCALFMVINVFSVKMDTCHNLMEVNVLSTLLIVQ